MSSEVAIRRAFLVAADKLIKERSDALNIVACVAALEAAISTMTDEPMRLLLVTTQEAETIQKKTGIDV